jgi:hypothetical protein
LALRRSFKFQIDPNSVVVGDQDSFKVEYLDQAITIKPLSGEEPRVISIFIPIGNGLMLSLFQGSEAIADYVVYLEISKRETTNSYQERFWHQVD